MESPDSLLKSALEKVVYFECRLDQLQRDLERSEADAAKLREDLARSATRELTLKQDLAAAQAAAAASERERSDTATQAAALRSERQRWLDKIIEAQRIRGAGADPAEGIDLAGFIAELRSEVIVARGGSAPERVGRPVSAEAAGNTLADQGRLAVSREDLATVQRDVEFKTRAEETLYAFSLRELTSGDAGARCRAAARLRTLEARAAVPALATALGAERDASVKAAILESLAAAGDATVIPLISPHLKAKEIDVRLAALEAASKLGDGPAIDRSLSDISPAVRRRAAVLAAARPEAMELLARAAADEDASVRRVAALTLAACSGDEAKKILLKALDDNDPTVRRAAAKGLSRLVGEDLISVADLDQAARRRQMRRIAESRKAIVESAIPAAAPEPKPVEAVVRPPIPAAPVPVAAAPESSSEVFARIKSEIRASLRGKTPEELREPLGLTMESVVAAARALEKSGALVRRGQRYFLA
jgi:HEAT repeat protein